MDGIMNIFTIAFAILIVSITYWLNIGNFSKIFLPIKLSHKSPYYASVKGELNQLTIQMSRIRSGKGTNNSYNVVGDYNFIVEGKMYEGMSNLGADNLYFINDAIGECRRYFPDQIIHLTTEIDKKNNMGIPLGEYNLYLKGMSFDFHPTQKVSPVGVYYDVLHPENNCLSIDASVSVIIVYILGILFCSSIGAFFAAGIMPGQIYYLKFIIGLLILATACVPAFYAKSKLPHGQIQNENENNDKVVLELVVDQNNSEQYIKEQILKQKEKLRLTNQQ
jgi:hypothetical protein